MKKILFIALASGFVVANTFAASVPYTFSNGTTADASEVNANFTALANAITALENKLASVTPPADLSGYSYCMITDHKGVGLADDGESASNTVGNGSGSMSFTSSSSGTWTDLSYISNEVDFYVDSGNANDILPHLVASRVQEHSLDVNNFTYTMDGNILNAAGIKFYVSPDANTIVGNLSETISEVGVKNYVYTAIVGVRADSCN